MGGGDCLGVSFLGGVISEMLGAVGMSGPGSVSSSVSKLKVLDTSVREELGFGDDDDTDFGVWKAFSA